MSTVTPPRYLSDITDSDAEKTALEHYEDACACVTGLLRQLDEQRARRDRNRAVAEAAIEAHNKRVADAIRAQYKGVNPLMIQLPDTGVSYPVTQVGIDRQRVVRAVRGHGKGADINEAAVQAARAALKAEGYVLPLDGRDK